MTHQTSRRTLTPGDKSSLIARMRGAVLAVADVPSTGPDTYRMAPRFEALEEYRSLTKHRSVAREHNVADPFFREQDGRAGATTSIDGREVLNFSSYDYLGLNRRSISTARRSRQAGSSRANDAFCAISSAGSLTSTPPRTPSSSSAAMRPTSASSRR